MFLSLYWDLMDFFSGYVSVEVGEESPGRLGRLFFGDFCGSVEAVDVRIDWFSRVGLVDE